MSDSSLIALKFVESVVSWLRGPAGISPGNAQPLRAIRDLVRRPIRPAPFQGFSHPIGLAGLAGLTVSGAFAVRSISPLSRFNPARTPVA
jgi:hypothetical protein